MRANLSRPEAFPAPPAHVDVAETHVSLVFLGERDVYKVKKPKNLGFLDFTTVEKRRAACEAEVVLNSRLAADVYLGVVPVRRGSDGRATFVGDGPIVDWAVHMRRLPDEQSALTRLSKGKLTPEDVDAVAELIADFHARARSDAETARYGDTDLIATNVAENFAQTVGQAGAYIPMEELREIEAWQTSMLTRDKSLFDARRAGGHVRDGHGDLRLDHVYFTAAGLRIIDCIEFNERFRFADVASDVGFFSMDLSRRGHVELAERFLARYARATGDFDLYSVVDFYESYRAYVRAKVSMMLASDEGAPLEARAAARAEARRCLLLSLAAERPSLLEPTLVAVGGIIASGKSTVAARIGDLLSAPVVDADRTRKHMLGRSHTDFIGGGAWSGPYDPAFTDRVYAEVLRRAEVVLASGRPVVLDASFRSSALRGSARSLAERMGVAFRFVECRVDEAVCRARLEAREKGPQVSDARAPMLADFKTHFEKVTELGPDVHVVIDTAQPIVENEARLREVVTAWPNGLVS